MTRADPNPDDPAAQPKPGGAAPVDDQVSWAPSAQFIRFAVWALLVGALAGLLYPRTVFVVRHAEKAAEPAQDPSLNERGPGSPPAGAQQERRLRRVQAARAPIEP